MPVVCMMNDGQLDCIYGYVDVGVLRRRGAIENKFGRGVRYSPPSGGVGTKAAIMLLITSQNIILLGIIAQNAQNTY